MTIFSFLPFLLGNKGHCKYNVPKDTANTSTKFGWYYIFQRAGQNAVLLVNTSHVHIRANGSSEE